MVILKCPFILVLYPETMSMMISNYDMLVVSKYIHVYPILMSIFFHPTEGKKVTYFQSRTQHLVNNEQIVEPLRHDTDIRYCFLLVYVTNAGSAADTCGNAGNNESRCRCGDGPGAGVAAGPPTPPMSDAFIPPPPPTSLPSPHSYRRRRHRYPAAAQPTTGAGAAAATSPEPAPPTTGAGGGSIWGRGNKHTVTYPVAEQDIQKRVQSSRRAG